MKISVALAYYLGEKYIEEQLRSILPQLSLKDEVVISVDGITEEGRALLRSLQEGDDRIRIIRGPGKGVVRNFDRAIRACRGDVIFLSDQDDIWEDTKVAMVMEAFEDPGVTAVLHNAKIINEQGIVLNEPTLFEFRNSKAGTVKNLLRNSYVGCCMAFRRELVPLICPIPKEMYMHDFWIGMAAERTGEVVLIEKPLLYYRRHAGNVTAMTHGPLGAMLTKRVNMIRCLRLLERRIEDQNRLRMENGRGDPAAAPDRQSGEGAEDE